MFWLFECFKIALIFPHLLKDNSEMIPYPLCNLASLQMELVKDGTYLKTIINQNLARPKYCCHFYPYHILKIRIMQNIKSINLTIAWIFWKVLLLLLFFWNQLHKIQKLLHNWLESYLLSLNFVKQVLNPSVSSHVVICLPSMSA